MPRKGKSARSTLGGREQRRWGGDGWLLLTKGNLCNSQDPRGSVISWLKCHMRATHPTGLSNFLVWSVSEVLFLGYFYIVVFLKKKKLRQGRAKF